MINQDNKDWFRAFQLHFRATWWCKPRTCADIPAQRAHKSANMVSANMVSILYMRNLLGWLRLGWLEIA